MWNPLHPIRSSLETFGRKPLTSSQEITVIEHAENLLKDEMDRVTQLNRDLNKFLAEKRELDRRSPAMYSDVKYETVTRNIDRTRKNIEHHERRVEIIENNLLRQLRSNNTITIKKLGILIGRIKDARKHMSQDRWMRLVEISEDLMARIKKELKNNQAKEG